MIETEITILINRKSDFTDVKKTIINSNIQFPVYIFELDSLYRIEFTSDYEEWELDNKILSCFPGYEFTKDLEKGRKEIRIQLTRYQSELSTDDWGRRIEAPLNETKYLIKKSESLSENYNPQIKVLFGESEQNYFINITHGINKSTDEKGFLLLNDFKTKDIKTQTEVLKDRLYKTSSEAFLFGYYKMQATVNEDYKKYIKDKKKRISQLHKAPRKIVRDFINYCNLFEITQILELLDSNVIFEKRFQNKTKIQIEGIRQFEEYLKSRNQDLCSKNFKIRSSWDINLPSIRIGVKFLSLVPDHSNSSLKYLQFSFIINNSNKIINIIEDCSVY